MPWGTTVYTIRETTGGDLGNRIDTGKYHCDPIGPYVNGQPSGYKCVNDLNFPVTATYPFTIPAEVNVSHIYRAWIGLDGGPGDGDLGTPVRSCNNVAWNCEEPVWSLNGVDMGKWRGGEIDPDLLHEGTNTVSIYTKPLWSEQDGTTLRFGWIRAESIAVSFYVPYVPSKMPQLDDLTTSPDLFITGHDIKVTPVITGESPDWEIVDISYYVLDKKTGAQEFYEVLANTNTLTYRPAPGAYGEKYLIAEMQVREVMTGKRETTEIYVPITIYFDKGLYPYWTDDNLNGTPNWFEYWAKDGAVPLLTMDIKYDPYDTSFGNADPNGEDITLMPLAPTTHYDTPLVIPKTNLSSSGESFGGPTVTGIDSVAEVLAHENFHRWVYRQHRPGALFDGMIDSDYLSDPFTGSEWDDSLPDFYEKTISYTLIDTTDTYDLQTLKNSVYEYYGDEEYMCMRAGNDSRGDPTKDWAYPGKQSGVRRTITGIFPTISPTCPANRCDVYSLRLPEGTFVGITDTPYDDNGDALYETLTVSNDISVSRTGTYEVTAKLWGEGTSGQEIITIVKNLTTLDEGTYSISARFPGTEISSAGIDGPYTIDLTWRNQYQEDGASPSTSWQTAPYLSSAFEPVSAVISGNAMAAPSNGDLKAVIPLTISKAGEYTIEGYLQDPGGVKMAHAADTAMYSAGATDADPVV